MSVPGPAIRPEESPEWRSGRAAAGASDASSGVRGQSTPTSHGGKTACAGFSIINSSILLRARDCRIIIWPYIHFEGACALGLLQGLGTDEETLMEILCTRTGKQLQDIAAAYNYCNNQSSHFESKQKQRRVCQP